MTKIIVTPIDMSAPGSYRERKKLLRSFATVMTASNSTTERDVLALLAAQDELDAIIIAHAETDDGSPLEAALDDISSDDFNALYRAIMNAETVPNSTSAS
jgi:hypothetical protein